MITTAALLSLAAQFGKAALSSIKEDAWPFLKEHWKQISWFALLLWVVICLLSHCSGVIDPWSRHGAAIDTVTTRIDTAWVYPDTAAIFALYGFDTLPRYVRHIENRLRFRPAPPVFPVDASCRDSLVVLRSHSEVLIDILEDCDSVYNEAIAIRHYGDTLRNDSIEVAVNFRVEGRLKGVPSIRYRYLAPYPVVTVTETVTNTVGPYRKVYVEGGLGPDMTWDNNLNTIRGSLGAGYTDKSNWSYGVRAGFTQNGYTVEGALRKSFDVGRKKSP
jgi:hypothetical protein